MVSDKKRKILLGTIIPVVTLSTAAISTAIVLSHKPVTPSTKKDFTVKFNPGEGHFAKGQNETTEVYANTRFDQIDQPVVENGDKTFAGWVDENNNPISGRQPVNCNLNLKATYNSSSYSDKAIIKFTTGDTGCTLQGNVSVSVNKGYFFFMINRPAAKLSGAYLKNWVYKTGSKAGEDVAENDKITENVTLIPKFVYSVGVTWDGNGATRTRGAETTYVESGTKFGEINQPSFEYGTSLFQGWYKEKECTNPWGVDDEVTENTTAYAKWDDAPSQYYCSIQYMQKPGTTITPIFSPGTSQVILKTTPWSSVFKPTITTETGDYVVDHWEYSLDGSSDWTTIEGEQVFNYDTVYIAPILVADAHLYIGGSDDIYMSSTSAAYKATVYPTSITGYSVYWSVKNWTGSEEKKPIIDDKGVIVTYEEEGDLTIEGRAVLTEGKELTETKTIHVYNPMTGTKDLFALGETGYIKLDMSTICNPDAATITGTYANGETYRVARSEFNLPITFGTNIQEIPDDFLANCPALTYAPVFTGDILDKIGNGFLYGCTSLNEDVTIPNSVTSIGDDFMANCTSFNKALTLSSGLKTIGSQFLMNCTSFNVNLAIPSSVESVGPYFMINNNAFTNTLTINCDGWVFDWGDIYSFSTSDSTCDHYQTGAIVDGTGAEVFKQLYKAADGEYQGESDIYRKYRES